MEKVASDVKCIAGEKLLCSSRRSAWCSVMTWRDRVGIGKGGSEEENICISMFDSCCYMSETNTIL